MLNFAIGRKPVHKLLAMLIYRPFIILFEKRGVYYLKPFECLDRSLRKRGRNTLIVGFHKNRHRSDHQINLHISIFLSQHVNTIARLGSKINLLARK